MQYLLSRTTSLVLLGMMTLTYTMDHNTRSWVDPRLKICSSSCQIKGLFTTAPIAKNTLLAVFGGTIMNKEAVLNLPDELVKNVLQIDDALWIGSSQVEPTDFINHSCNPNAGLKGQLFLVAMRDIACGEEITFDYATVVSEWVGMEPLTCNCQTPSCRKKIEANDWQNKQLQKKYNGYFAYYIQKKIDTLSNNQSK
jgi:hypothetical protein